MAILNMSCACGYRWEAIKSASTADRSLEECPKCQGRNVAQEFSIGGSFNRGFDYSGADPREKLMLREQNQYIEEHAAEVLSGAMTIREAPGMPSHLRPQVPDHLKKRFY